MSLSPADFVNQLLEHTGLDPASFKVEVVDEDQWLKINIAVAEEESGILIGVHGETLSSLQRLVRLAYLTTLADKKIVVNINDYRERREEKLKSMVESVAERVLATGQPHTLPSYLPSYERFFIHTLLSSDDKYAGLTSSSTGMGRDRRLTIAVKS